MADDEEEEEEAIIAPLIQDEPHQGEHRPQESDLKSPNAFIWALTFTAGLSGLLFGYECALFLSPSYKFNLI